jgi:hypothetical protein
MIGMCAILLAAQLGAADAGLGEWSVVLAAASGWGGRPGIYVDSTGRNVAMSPQNGGSPSWYCKEMPLDVAGMRAIAEHISGIPSDVLGQGGLLIRGRSCADDPVNDVTLTIQGHEYHFSYSQMETCRDGQQVPTWLSRLVDALWVRYYEIERCKLTPFKAPPKQ